MKTEGGIKNETRILREVSLVEREDGRIIRYDAPVPCDCCGKVCTVRYFEMTNGARFGKECATVFHLAEQHTRYQAVAVSYLEWAIRANAKQIAYMLGMGVAK